MTVSDMDIGYHARMTTSHDPGPDAANARSTDVAAAAAEPIEVAGGGTVRIGTASWTDPTMIAPGVFYPRGADTAEERLHFYAETFPVVEVDATYYALPAPRTAELWVDRTPPDFTFDIKAHALMTGQGTETKRLPKVIRDELTRRAPREATDLRQGPPGRAPGCGLVDVPRRPRTARRARPAGLDPAPVPALGLPVLGEPGDDRGGGRRLDGWQCSVEFRNGSWLNEKNAERTIRFLADRGIAFVMVDEPQGFKSSVPPVTAVTSKDLAIVRFHGRNAATWEAKGITPAERFRYLYSREELGEWVPRIREAAGEARETHVLMNNCYANYGTTNAREIAHLLEDLDVGG